MSYDFDYIPSSGLTPWPMIWTVVPSQYNWEGTLGDTISFSVKAIPDPDYPTAWDDNFTVTTDDGMGGTTTTPAPPLPPEPILSEYVYEPTSTMGEEHVSVHVEHGMNLDSVGTELFFPYAEITYFKNDVKKSAQYPQEVIDDGYDYVCALVPSSQEFIIKTSVLRAVSTSKHDLTGTFQFKINNDWTRARTTLETMAVRSKEYFDQLVGSEGSEPSNPPSQNEGSSGELENDMPILDDNSESFKEEHSKSYDDFFRTASDDDINTILDDNPDFIGELKQETQTNTSLESNEKFGTTESPIDKAIRNGNIDELMNTHGYSYSEVIDLIRGL